MSDSEQITIASGEEVMVFVFPHGTQAFAANLKADVLQVEYDALYYYSEGKWKSLEDLPDRDSKSNTLVSLHKPQK